MSGAVAATPPDGTIRDMLDARGAAMGTTVSHVFSNAAPLTWAELRDGALEIAGRLAGLGIARGESVALMLPNSREAILCIYGIFYGGFRAAIINLVAGTDAIGYALEHSEARFVLTGTAQRALFDAAIETSGAEDRVTCLEVSPGGVKWPGGNELGDLPPLAPGDHALLMYTSGTTGRPKGVLHSHASLLAGGWTTALAHELSPADRGLCVLPIFHINGLCVSVMGTLVSGGTLVLCEKFSASQFWSTCAQNRITWFSVVPTIISHLLHGAADPEPRTKAHTRFGRSASSALAVETQSAFEARFGIPIVETMGLTETAAQILSNPLPPGRRKIGSPGLAWGNEVAILSPDLMLVAPETEGEIAVRGPNVMLSYFKNPEATGACLTPNGWLRTGDLGRMDADGYVYVTGRLKELIIKGGENIAPREVDEALYSHPDVVEAAAFARPCASYGERVEAAVKLREGATVDGAALRQLCEAKLGTFKCPDIVHILDDLPKGPSGKIQRLKLGDLVH